MKKKFNRVDTRYVKQHLRTSIFKGYILYTEKYHPEVDMVQVCDRAGLPFDYVVEEDNWVSVEFEKNFMIEYRKVVKDPDIVRKVGVFAASPEVVGASIYFFITKLLTLTSIFQKLPFMTSLINKVMNLEIENLEKGNVIFKLSPIYENLSKYEQEIVRERIPEFAENTVGYFYQIPLARGLPAPKITVSHEGDAVLMDVKFVQDMETFQRFVDIALVVLAPILTAIGATALGYTSQERLVAVLGVAVFGMGVALVRKIRHSYQTAINAANNLKKMDQQVETLVEAKKQLSRKLDESDAVSQVVQAIASADEEKEVLDATCEALGQYLRFDRAVILLADENQKRLNFRSGFGLNDTFDSDFKNFYLEIGIESSDPNKISNVYRLGYSILIDDVENHVDTLIDDASRNLLKSSNSTSFAAVPIKTAQQSHGVLIADCYEQGKNVTQDDLVVLQNIGKQLAVALEKSNSKGKLEQALEETKKLSESYSRFVPFETLKQMEYESVYNVKIGDGTNKIFAVLFSDIRDFTSLSESMSPHDVLAFLNSYYGMLSPIIKSHNGIIDKFIGDCVMAIFPNPTDAIQASIDIQRKIIKYNIERRLGGRSTIFCGIGVCYGKVVMGPIGFDGRLDITVLSDAVNTASRLDSLCKDLNAKILVSGVGPEIITSTAPEVQTIDHGGHKIRGKNREVNVVEILDPELIDQFKGMEMTEELARFKEIYISHIIRKIEFQKKKKAS